MPWIAFGAVIAAVVLMVALNWPGPARSTLDLLRARPEASLFYPGSTLIRSGSHPATEEDRAGIWRMLGTDAPEAAVLAFYRRELVTRGVVPGGGMAATGILAEGQVCTWHTTDFVFRLSFWRLDEWRSRYPEESRYPTVYEVRLLDWQDNDDSGVCRYD